MQIREAIDKHRTGVTWGAAAVAVLAIAAVIWQTRSDGPPPANTSSKAFYTIDDGKTWFAGDVQQVPPFQHDGKTALGCTVFRVDGKDQVGYLTQYAEAARKGLIEDRAKAKALQQSSGEPVGSVGLRYLNDTLVKRPGDKAWVELPSPRGQEIAKLPAGAEPVTPD